MKKGDKIIKIMREKWENFKYWMEEYGFGIFAFSALLLAPLLFFGYLIYKNKTRPPKPPEPEVVYEEDYHMIYFLDCQGQAYDSIKLDYYDFKVRDGYLNWYTGDTENKYNGVFLIKELDD